MICLLIAGFIVYGLCKLFMWSFEPLYYTYTKTSKSCDDCTHRVRYPDGDTYCLLFNQFANIDSCDNHTTIIPKEKINEIL